MGTATTFLSHVSVCLRIANQLFANEYYDFGITVEKFSTNLHKQKLVTFVSGDLENSFVCCGLLNRL